MFLTFPCVWFLHNFHVCKKSPQTPPPCWMKSFHCNETAANKSQPNETALWHLASQRKAKTTPEHTHGWSIPGGEIYFTQCINTNTPTPLPYIRSIIIIITVKPEGLNTTNRVFYFTSSSETCFEFIFTTAITLDTRARQCVCFALCVNLRCHKKSVLVSVS